MRAINHSYISRDGLVRFEMMRSYVVTCILLAFVMTQSSGMHVFDVAHLYV